MLKRLQPDSHSAEEMAGWNKHAAQYGDIGGDAGSDEVTLLRYIIPR